MSEIQLKIEKSKVPIIWLDTSIIFNMTKWKRGESLDSTTRERMEHLHGRIYDLTRQKKLICSRADQDEEIWIGRPECLEMMLSLSLGIRSKYSESVKDFQTRQFMEAFLHNEDEVTISYRDFFHDDPIEQLNNVSDLVIDADLGLIDSGEKIKVQKQRQLVILEEKRPRLVEQGVSYEDQLEKEYNGDLEAIGIILRKLLTGQLPSNDPQAAAVLEVVTQHRCWWEELGGEPAKLSQFFTSAHYRTIPTNSISSRICAKLITGKDPIKPSHSMDIHHASSAIPYIDFFITDRYMKHILTTELAIDKEYQTVICHVGDSDQIEAFFNGL